MEQGLLMMIFIKICTTEVKTLEQNILWGFYS